MITALGGPVKLRLAVPPAQTEEGPEMVGDIGLMVSVQISVVPGAVLMQPLRDTL